MSDLILECNEYAEFMKHMPEVLNNGHAYLIGVDYNPRSNTFVVTSFEEEFDHGWIQTVDGKYPEYLHCRILDGCQALHQALEQRELENEEVQSRDDYILDHDGDCDYKGDKYEF
jgi:hypothetical protein